MGEEKVSKEEFAYSLMLIMSITFQMTIFYLVNWPDDDIRAYAWSIIGNTILIFSGVMTFTSLKEFALEFWGETEYKWLFSLIQFLCWVSVMQLVIAWCSGWGRKKKVAGTTDTVMVALDDRPRASQETRAPSAGNGDKPRHLVPFPFMSKPSNGLGIVCCRRRPVVVSPPAASTEAEDSTRDLAEEEKTESGEREEEEKHQREMNNECFASLLGHISGFAAIDFFGFLQQETKLAETPWGAGSASIIAIFSLLATFRLWSLVRRHIIKPDEEVEEMWHEFAIDKENDVIGLASSRLAFLALRFALVHKLPNLEGGVVATPEKALVEMWQVALIGVFWIALVILLLWVHNVSGLVDPEDEESWPTRISNIGQNFCNMCVSWASLLNVKLLLLYLSWFKSGGVIDKIVVAFLISYAAFLLIRVLDKVDDWAKDHNIQADWMDNIITAMGLAIGFAWEQSFDQATDDLGLRLMLTYHIDKKNKTLINLGFSLLLCAIVLPAFRWYILPSVEEAEKVKKEKDDMIKAKFRGMESRSFLLEAGNAFGGEIGRATSVVSSAASSVGSHATNAASFVGSQATSGVTNAARFVRTQTGEVTSGVTKVARHVSSSMSQPFLYNEDR